MMALTLADLAHRSVWVGWKQRRKDGRSTKLPYDPRTNQLAQSDNPSTWADQRIALGSWSALVRDFPNLRARNGRELKRSENTY
jgi:hypothetical protein